MGRPRKYKSPEEFTQAVDEYVEYCYANETPVTMTGMALHLGFSSRKDFYRYQDFEEFCHAVKRARLRVEHEYEKRLSGSSPAGAIFALKNMEWSDKQEVEHSGGVVLNFDPALKDV